MSRDMLFLLQVFYGSMEPSVSTSILFVEPIQAQSVRLYPQSWGTHIAVRWELNGCVYGEWFQRF